MGSAQIIYKVKAGDCIDSVSVQINVIPLPAIELSQANAVICVGSASAEINYSTVTGDPLPTVYNINWDNLANTAGLSDVSNKNLTGVITIDGLSGIPAGVYHGILTVKNNTNSIVGNDMPVSITIRPLPSAGISYGSASFCTKGKISVALTGDGGGRFSSAPGLSINELSGEINLSESIPGNYTITYSLSNDACTVTATANLSINALPLISGITGASTIPAGSTSQLSSNTPGGTWASSNEAVAEISSRGLVTALKMGSAQIIYKVKAGDCIDSVRVQINVIPVKAGALMKIMNENRSILFSSSEFYDLIDPVTKANDPSKSLMTRIRIESLPANGLLKLKDRDVIARQEILFSEISDLAYFPETNFRGIDSFEWNWSDLSGRYAAQGAKVSISVIAKTKINQYSVNENEIFKGQAFSVGRIDFVLEGIDSSGVSINSVSGEVTMKARDFELPVDSDSDNNYDFVIRSSDARGNSYSENWRIMVQNVEEYSKLEFEQVPNTEIPENSEYQVRFPKLKGFAQGKISYKLIGNDSLQFKLDVLSGIVSMEGKVFNSASDRDKDNVYEVGLKATDSDRNTALVFWKVKVIKVQQVQPFSMMAVENVMIDEKTFYTSPAPALLGRPAGKVLYALTGKDSNLFTVNELTGIVSMEGREFDSPLDYDKNNVYEIGLIAKDSVGRSAVSEWKVIIKMLHPSAAQSMLSPEIMSMPISGGASHILTVITKYPNGERYVKGGEQVLIKKISGSATISKVTDLKDGTYTAQIYPGPAAGRSIFVATLAGKDIMNGSGVTAKAIVEFGISNDTRLSGLGLSFGNLLPQFKTDVFEYSTFVEYSVDSISISPSLNDPNAKVEINGVNASKSGSVKVPLLIGKNLVSVLVIAADGLSKQRYKININRAEAVFPYQESFMGDVAEGLVFDGNPNKAKLTSGAGDVSGMGYLKLTNNKPKESGFVYNSKKIPSAKGLTISFEYYSHGAGAGDGLSFFLFDASASFKIGALGGSLGYAQNLAQAGLNKGFLGLGLDEYGEFSNATLNKQGGPGRRPGSVVLRGDGNGDESSKDNYEYLTGIQTTDETAMRLAGAGSKFQIFGNQDGRTAPGGALDQDEPGYRKLKMQLLPNNNKTGFIINVWITEGSKKSAGIVHHVIRNYTYIPTGGIPADLKYGFAANSGNSANSYEIRNLEIVIPDASAILPSHPVIDPIETFPDPQATNLITPNGDGINDTWIVRNIDNYSINSVRIFNRFGEEVYRKKNYMNDWDGKKDGQPLPVGTYYYVFENSNSKHPLKGYITIME